MAYLIALDGIDASGKTTQAKILEKKLEKSGNEVLYLTFPVYESESSSLVRLYLGGRLGAEPGDVNAYAASSFFAADRYISYIAGWKRFYDKENSIIIANRYTTANAIHQLPKLPRQEWDSFLDWLYDYEFEKLKLPRPDLAVFFDMDPNVSISLLEARAKKGQAKKDIHESDHEYLKKSYEAGCYAASHLGWQRLECCKKNGEAQAPKSEEEISEALFKLVEALWQR